MYTCKYTHANKFLLEYVLKTNLKKYILTKTS